MAIIERHKGTGNIGMGFVKGFGLKHGALASSVAHDSHNIIVVGTTDADMRAALEAVVKMGGGLAGHNGLRSINQMCGGPDFQRIRLGIGHPGHKDRVSGYVLNGFAKDEINTRDDMCNGIARYADLLAEGTTDMFQTRVAEYIAR